LRAEGAGEERGCELAVGGEKGGDDVLIFPALSEQVP